MKVWKKIIGIILALALALGSLEPYWVSASGGGSSHLDAPELTLGQEITFYFSGSHYEYYKFTTSSNEDDQYEISLSLLSADDPSDTNELICWLNDENNASLGWISVTTTNLDAYWTLNHDLETDTVYYLRLEGFRYTSARYSLSVTKNGE